MAILLTKSSAIFYEIPKTGTRFVEHVLTQLGIGWERPEPEVRASLAHALPCHFSGQFDFRFCAVRHPFSWLESWYRFQSSLGWPRWEVGRWHPQRILEPCATELGFERFLCHLLLRQPGYVSRLFEWYVGPPGAESVDVVLRQESLAAGLADVLARLGYEVRREDVEAIGRVNESCGDPVDWSPCLRDRIFAAEWPAIKRFYGGSKSAIRSGLRS